MYTEIIKKYANLMAELPYDVGAGAQLLIKQDGRIFGTLKGCDLKNIQNSEIKDLTCTVFPEIRTLGKLKKYDAMVVFKTPYVGACLDSETEVPAILDDMAQIVGHKVCISDYAEKKLYRKLLQSCAVMIKDGYALAVGRNLYEAYVAMTVFEKSAEVFIKAEVIGGGKKINSFEAKAMRLIYEKKYSSAERKHKDECEG